MNAHPLLPKLSRQLIVIAVGGVLAIALALKIGHGSTDHTGLAKIGVLLDTPEPQLVDSNPPGVNSLPWRGLVLAELIGSESTVRQIAADAGVPEGRLAVVEPRLGVPTVPASLPRAAAEAAAIRREPYVLTVRSDEVLPLISIKAEAPDRGAAARLAGAAVSALEAGTGLGRKPDSPRFTVRRSGAIKTRDVAPDGRLLLAGGAGMAFFVLWCGSMLLAGRFLAGTGVPSGALISR